MLRVLHSAGVDSPSPARWISMLCDARTRLLSAFCEATDRYSGAVIHLQGTSRASNPEAWDFLTLETERAREACERARLALEEHTSSHGCGLGQVPAAA